MKAFNIEIPDILQGITTSLDITHILCDRTWVVFNDENIRIVLIFEKNGTLIISRKGIVSNGSWRYIKANSSILINSSDIHFLLHPTFLDNVVFALRQDGTENYLFMIDDKQLSIFTNLTLISLKHYFDSKALKAIEEQERIRLQEEKEKQEIELKRAEGEAERIKWQRKAYVRQQIKNATRKYDLYAWLVIFPLGTLFMFAGWIPLFYIENLNVLTFILLLFAPGLIGMHVIAKGLARKLFLHKVDAIKNRILQENGMTMDETDRLFFKDQFWEYVRRII